MFGRLKVLIPRAWLFAYHDFLARLAACWYRYPSRELVVIGVTGTNGKTTTSYLIAKLLEDRETPTGCTTTAIVKIGKNEWLNDTKMTMPGRFYLQRMLRKMVDAGCRYAVIETTSQGLIQHRHKGIAYDVAVFTNLTPEHVEAHGGFENYKCAKRLLFEQVASLPPKSLYGKPVPRVALLNADDPYADFYAKITGLYDVRWFGIQNERGLCAKQIELTGQGAQFFVRGVPVRSFLPGRYNAENVLAALGVGEIFGVPIPEMADRLLRITHIPGRFELVEEGQPWMAIVDYAPEPASLGKLYEVIQALPHERLIHVLGSTGGGRDVARRKTLGQMAGKTATLVIVTNEDPYDEDPQKIIDQVAEGAKQSGKTEGTDLWKIFDRKEAIEFAMRQARSGDIVLMTGKGCETWICVKDGKKIPWDERRVAREAISKTFSKTLSSSV